jgi:hypothetical protein
MRHVVSQTAGHWALLIWLAALCAGCAGQLPPPVPLSASAKSEVRVVGIKDEFTLPLDSRAWGPPAFRQVTSDFGHVVRVDFEDQLKKSQVFPSIGTEGADAEFTLGIGNMTIQVATGMCGGLFRHCYTPVIMVWGVLRARDGTVLWRSRQLVTNVAREVPKRDLAEYEERPALAREDLAVAAKIAVARLVKDLAEPHP